MNVQELIQTQHRLVADRILASLADLSADELLARPNGLVPVIWHVGHVAFYDALLAKRAGETPAIPEGYEELFKYGSTGSDSLPPADDVIRFFHEAHSGLLNLAQGDLDRPVQAPLQSYQTVGEGLMRMLYHRGYHHGKIMTLRSLLNKSRLLG